MRAKETKPDLQFKILDVRFNKLQGGNPRGDRGFKKRGLWSSDRITSEESALKKELKLINSWRLQRDNLGEKLTLRLVASFRAEKEAIANLEAHLPDQMGQRRARPEQGDPDEEEGELESRGSKLSMGYG